MVSDITKVMSQPIYGYEELNLFDHLGQFWPWTDTVDYASDNTVYGSNVCGPLEYIVTDANFQPVDIVRLSPDGSTLIYEPLPIHEPAGRQIELKLVARLPAYPSVPIGFDSFKVNLLECNPTVDASLV